MLILNLLASTLTRNLMFIVLANIAIFDFVILLITFAIKQEVASDINKKQLKTIT